MGVLSGVLVSCWGEESKSHFGAGSCSGVGSGRGDKNVMYTIFLVDLFNLELFFTVHAIVYVFIPKPACGQRNYVKV